MYWSQGYLESIYLDAAPSVSIWGINNPRALGQGLVGVWLLYHFPVVPTQGAIPEKGKYLKKNDT